MHFEKPSSLLSILSVPVPFTWILGSWLASSLIVFLVQPTEGGGGSRRPGRAAQPSC